MAALLATFTAIVIIFIVLQVFQDTEEEDGSGKFTTGEGIRLFFWLLSGLIGAVLGLTLLFGPFFL